MAERLAILMDNPILIRHARSRLRPYQLMPWAVIVLVLCLCIVYGGYVTRTLPSGSPLGVLLFLQVILFIFIGGQQVGASISAARSSGILDFHRVSPLPPLHTVVGFFFGAPIREYLLTALTLPFALILGLLGPSGVFGLLALEIPILLAAWILHSAALLSALVSKKPKTAGAGTIGLIILGLLFGQWIFLGISYASTRLQIEGATLSFFGLRMHWLVFLVLYMIPVLFFLFLPSVRKMRSERLHAYTKSQAIGCMATLTTLVLGAAWDLKGTSYLVLVLTHVFLILGLILTSTITPTQSEYVRGLRRAIRYGQLRPSFWSDEGVNRLAVGIIAAIATLGATIGWEAIEGRINQSSLYSQTIAIATLVLLYFGLGLQFSLLRAPKRGATYFGLLLFFAWVLPLILGLIAVASGAENSAPLLFGISPVAGIVLSSGAIDVELATPSRAAALLPAVTFTVIFYFLLDATQRRLDRSVRSSMPQVELDPWSNPEPKEAASDLIPPRRAT